MESSFAYRSRASAQAAMATAPANVGVSILDASFRQATPLIQEENSLTKGCVKHIGFLVSTSLLPDRCKSRLPEKSCYRLYMAHIGFWERVKMAWRILIKA